ncbi:AMP-binding protein [Paraburkholderia dipogonis]|uniref:AMP-binding protein n=1 Tax=Paraburkholderia dipogonis TaxID=1211383 RepID=UPI0035E65A3A
MNTLYNAFLDKRGILQGRDFSDLKLAMAGGMATQKSVAERFKAVTGKPIMSKAMGLTECSPIVSMNPVGPLQHARLRRLDRFCPRRPTQVRFRKDDGNWANIGEAGELCVKGPHGGMKGYLESFRTKPPR